MGFGVRPMRTDKNRRRPGNQRPRMQREMKKASWEKPRAAGLFSPGDRKPQLAEMSRTISVEMVEAIGERRWPTYFSLLDQVVADGDRGRLQVMTIRHDRFLSARRRQTWINKHVPHGLFTSFVPTLKTAASRQFALKVLDSKAFGLHFAGTLRI
jgi:cyclopropane fatty-acyl-phospholipid synthase-like methyltransferase